MSLDVNYTRGRPLPRAEAIQQLPKLAANRRRNVFRIVAHPEAWEYLDDVEGDGVWLPTVKCLPLRPGVNGVDAHPDGRLKTASWDSGMQANGWVNLTFHPDLCAKHGEDGQLVFEHPQSDGGKHFGPPWELIGVVNGRTKKRCDEDAFRAFREDVSGILGGMPVEQLEERLEQHDARTNQMRQDRSGGPQLMENIKSRDAKADRMRAAWMRQFGKDAPSKDKDDFKPIKGKPVKAEKAT